MPANKVRAFPFPPRCQRDGLCAGARSYRQTLMEG